MGRSPNVVSAFIRPRASSRGSVAFYPFLLGGRQIMLRSKTNVTSAPQMFPCYLYILDCGQLPTSAPNQRYKSKCPEIFNFELF